MVNRELTAPCGLYCGACGVYYATKHNDAPLREKLAGAYGMPVEELACRGCLSDTVFPYCRVCAIKSCASERGVEGCHQCDEFPCDRVESFPVPEGKANILRAVPRWRELGTDRWVAEEERLVSCPSCSTVLFRGAKKCRKCGTVMA